MNEVGPITDLAMCEDAIQTAVQKCSFSQRIQKFLDLYLADRGDQQGPEALFQVSLEQRQHKPFQSYRSNGQQWQTRCCLKSYILTVLLSNIARLYHRSYRMWGYLPTTQSSINLSHLTSREKVAVEIITIQKCTISGLNFGMKYLKSPCMNTFVAVSGRNQT